VSTAPSSTKEGKVFQAVNGTLIPYFEEVELMISLGYDRTVTWHFVTANVVGAIMGCDFFLNILTLL